MGYPKRSYPIMVLTLRERLEQSWGHHKSSPYWPQTNGAIEVANKNIKNILAKMVVPYKDWTENLPFAL